MTFSLLGIDIQTGQRVDIPQASRRQGTYIIGANGTGKTGLIENLVIQDIQQGLGVGLLDPHGDLTQAVLSRIPDTREKDVIYVDIADEAFPFGLNLFACDNPQSIKAVQYVVDQVMHIFDKLFAVDRATPLLSEYLRNCTHTLVVNPGFTMADIPLLLLNADCRKKLTASVTDPDVLLFWQTYEQMKPSEQREEASSTLRRVREFLQPLSRNIIGQSTTTINFRSVMDERKILLVKLDARLSSITSLIGSMIIALFLNAAYSRTDTEIKKRKQFNLYADEFQRFATEDFATLLTEARKFGIATTIAHQMREQLDQQNRSATLNVANVIVFKISGKDADELSAEFDSTPPSPDVIGQRPVLVPKQDVIQHLLTQGHPNPHALAFQWYAQVIQDYTGESVRQPHFARHMAGDTILDSAITYAINRNRAKKYVDAMQLQAEAKQMLHDINAWLYLGMQTSDSTLELPNEIFLTAARVCYFDGLLRPFDTHQREITLLCSAETKDWDEAKNTLVRIGYKDQEEQWERCLNFLDALRSTFFILCTEPILVDSGRWEPIYDKPRPYADVQNEISTRLANMPKFTARVKIIRADDKPVEYTVKTLSPERGFQGMALQDRSERIRANNILHGYVRDRTIVEEEIRKRYDQNTQPAQQGNLISRRSPILACANCGAQYRQGAKFCNKCGNPI